MRRRPGLAPVKRPSADSRRRAGHTGAWLPYMAAMFSILLHHAARDFTVSMSEISLERCTAGYDESEVNP